MDITNAITQWVLSQIESVSGESLSRGLGILKPDRWLGMVMSDREAEEVRALLDRPASDQPREPTVIIPGIMGSQLASVRGISALLWPNPRVLLDGHLNLLDLDDDGFTDRSPDVDIVPLGIETMSYLQLVLTLARETRLYEFPYDWRQSIVRTADTLATSLERWASAQPDRCFTLVCHSMGGLVARAYMAKYPREAERRVKRLIMLGTPLQGAPEATLLFSGDAPQSRIITHLHPGNDAISFAANLPSVYQLLPPPPEVFYGEGPYPLDWDPYEAPAWGIEAVRPDLLHSARLFHERVRYGQPDVEQIEIAGCHCHTMTGAQLAAAGAEGPHIVPVYTDLGPESGDEQVPIWSTRLPEVSTCYVEQTHHALVQSGAALEAVVSLVHGGTVDLPFEVPAPTLRRGVSKVVPFGQQVAELRRRMTVGSATREDIHQIFFAG